MSMKYYPTDGNLARKTEVINIYPDLVLDSAAQPNHDIVGEDSIPAATPDSIAAKYYELQHLCYPLPTDDALRGGQIMEIARYIQVEGKRGAEQLALSVAGFRSELSDNLIAQELASTLMNELAQYNDPVQKSAPQEKTHHRKSQER